MRIVALLLAIVMMAGTATEVCADIGDVAGAVDDLTDLAMPSVAEPVAIARPDHRPIASIEAPDAPPGRAHAVLIFRPPR